MEYVVRDLQSKGNGVNGRCDQVPRTFGRWVSSDGLSRAVGTTTVIWRWRAAPNSIAQLRERLDGSSSGSDVRVSDAKTSRTSLCTSRCNWRGSATVQRACAASHCLPAAANVCYRAEAKQIYCETFPFSQQLHAPLLSVAVNEKLVMMAKILYVAPVSKHDEMRSFLQHSLDSGAIFCGRALPKLNERSVLSTSPTSSCESLVSTPTQTWLPSSLLMTALHCFATRTATRIVLVDSKGFATPLPVQLAIVSIQSLVLVLVN